MFDSSADTTITVFDKVVNLMHLDNAVESFDKRFANPSVLGY